MKFLFLSGGAHLILDPDDPGVSGGGELQVALLARELARAGHEVTILSGDDGQDPDRILDGVRCRVAGKFHSGKAVEMARAIPRVFSLIREERPDWVFIYGWTAWLALIVAARPLLQTKIGYICGLDTEIDGRFRQENPVRGACFEFGVRHADVRFAMSENQRSQFARLGLDCGFFLSLIKERVCPENVSKDIDFLWVARGMPIKRPHLFLDAIEPLVGQRCVMICPNHDPELWASLEARAAKIPHLEFRDSVSYDEIQSWFERARVFVSTSEAEGFPNTFVQAALGRAAIVSLEVDPDGVLESFGGGIMVKTATELNAVLATLAGDSERVAQMQRCAPDFVHALLDNEKNVKAFLAGLDAGGRDRSEGIARLD